MEFEYVLPQSTEDKMYAWIKEQYEELKAHPGMWAKAPCMPREFRRKPGTFPVSWYLKNHEGVQRKEVDGEDWVMYEVPVKATKSRSLMNKVMVCSFEVKLFTFFTFMMLLIVALAVALR